MKKNMNKYAKQGSLYMKSIYTGVRGNFDRLGKELTSLDKARDRLAQLKADLNLKSIKNKKILEIGSGFGVTLKACAEEGALCNGIEPDQKAFQISRKINQSNIGSKKVHISEGVGEQLPYKNNSFDIVISFQVLEHVQDPKKVISEACRVLKKNGYLYFVIPNYYSFWEGHYEVLWFPNLLLFKPLAKAYLHFVYRKQNINFLNSLNNITPQLIQKLFKSHKKNIELITLGQEKFAQRMINKNYSPEWGGTSKLALIKKLFTYTGLSNFIAQLFNKLNLFYPIVVVARKKHV